MTKLLSIPEGALVVLYDTIGANIDTGHADFAAIDAAFTVLKASAIQQGEAPVAWR